MRDSGTSDRRATRDHVSPSADVRIAAWPAAPPTATNPSPRPVTASRPTAPECSLGGDPGPVGAVGGGPHERTCRVRPAFDLTERILRARRPASRFPARHDVRHGDRVVADVGHSETHPDAARPGEPVRRGPAGGALSDRCRRQRHRRSRRRSVPGPHLAGRSDCDARSTRPRSRGRRNCSSRQRQPPRTGAPSNRRRGTGFPERTPDPGPPSSRRPARRAEGRARCRRCGRRSRRSRGRDRA